jgi:type I restriction-modification system DNA methylase subunit
LRNLFNEELKEVGERHEYLDVRRGYAEESEYPSKMTRQETLPMFDLSDVVDRFARSAAEERGAVFTRREVVEFILDLSGYTAEQPLHQLRLLEPAFGNGDFLLPAVNRLLKAYKTRSSEHSNMVEDLSRAIRAVEVHRDSIEKTRAKLSDLLHEHGASLAPSLQVGMKKECGRF